MHMVTEPGTGRRDGEAVEELWREFASRLRAFISTRVSNQADVDDILQEVFVKIQRNEGKLRNADRLTTWIFRIAHNTIIDHYRAAPRRREVPVDELDSDGHAPPSDAMIDDPSAVRAQLAACVQPLIAQLPAHSRQALELVELGGMSQTDAARELGLSVSGMKSRVQRARAQVFGQLNDWCSLTVDARGGPVDCQPGPDSPCG